MTGRLQSASKRLLNQPYALMWAGARLRARVSHPAACLFRFFSDNLTEKLSIERNKGLVFCLRLEMPLGLRWKVR